MLTTLTAVTPLLSLSPSHLPQAGAAGPEAATPLHGRPRGPRAALELLGANVHRPKPHRRCICCGKPSCNLTPATCSAKS